MNHKITGFHKDQDEHWVAELECGHSQHVRHDPPWMERPWVISEEGRASRIGIELNCARCDDIVKVIVTTLLPKCKKIMSEAYEEAGISGLCTEGRFEVALNSLDKIKVGQILAKAFNNANS